MTTSCSAAVSFFLLFFLTFNQFQHVKSLTLGELSPAWVKNNCPSNASLPSNLVGLSAGSGTRTFGQAFNTFVGQVKTWKMYSISTGPVCNIFSQWVRWVKTLFNEVHCDSGVGKWCTADRNNGRLITDTAPPTCTPHHCKYSGGKKCKFHSSDTDPRNNDGQWKRGTCKTRVPCMVTCLRVHSTVSRSANDYAGKIQEVWGKYINAASKRDEDQDEEEEETEEPVNDDKVSSLSLRSQKKQQAVQWLKSLVDKLSTRGKRSNIGKRFDWSCDSNSFCDTCPGGSTGAYCKEWADSTTNCCVCVTW